MILYLYNAQLCITVKFEMVLRITILNTGSNDKLTYTFYVFGKAIRTGRLVDPPPRKKRTQVNFPVSNAAVMVLYQTDID